MSQITAYALNFSARLKSGIFYKEILSEKEKQGHEIVAVLLEKAVASAEVMASLSDDLFNQLVKKNVQLATLLAPKREATDATAPSQEESTPPPQADADNDSSVETYPHEPETATAFAEIHG